MKTLTLPAYAYADQWTRPEDIATGKAQPVITVGRRSEYFESEGHTLIGTATVTVNLYGEDDIRQRQIDMLKTQLQRERAATEVRQNAILDSISKLQAIEYHV